MLLKSKDDIATQLTELDNLLRLPISPEQRSAIERERALLWAELRLNRNAQRALPLLIPKSLSSALQIRKSSVDEFCAVTVNRKGVFGPESMFDAIS